jgi:signal transduction histidine kinase
LTIKQTIHIKPFAKRLSERFCALSRQILRFANQGVPRVDFLRGVAEILLDFTDASSVLIKICEKNRVFSCEKIHHSNSELVEKNMESPAISKEKLLDSEWFSEAERLSFRVFTEEIPPTNSCMTNNGTIRLLEKENRQWSEEEQIFAEIGEYGRFACFMLIPFEMEDQSPGFLRICFQEPQAYIPENIDFYEGVAQTLGLAASDRRAQAALRERVKELGCLYRLNKLTARHEQKLEWILQEITEILPEAWLYPHVASSRIVIDDLEFTSPDWQIGAHSQRSSIFCADEIIGFVEVTYSEINCLHDEGPFLAEERHLLDLIAKETGSFIERRRNLAERNQLTDQLRHADRLATIGQLTAGVTHELNEPLGAILGFSHLILETADCQPQVKSDVENIKKSALHAREIIRKLMFFARQNSSSSEKVDLNKVIRDGLYFLETRCQKSGIVLQYQLAENLPLLQGDSSELLQVLVNLVVNAIQSMEKGGQLLIFTKEQNDSIRLGVEDTGCGMTEETREKMFFPFFTTKDVQEGTGLGLAVVHGILKSHQGKVEVNSQLGQGTKIYIDFPALSE